MTKSSLRGQYGKTILDLGRTNENIVVMDADLAKSTKTLTFAKEIAHRFFDMGLSEQDMVSTAAGLSLTGKTVFASSFCVIWVSLRSSFNRSATVIFSTSVLYYI